MTSKTICCWRVDADITVHGVWCWSCTQLDNSTPKASASQFWLSCSIVCVHASTYDVTRQRSCDNRCFRHNNDCSFVTTVIVPRFFQSWTMRRVGTQTGLVPGLRLHIIHFKQQLTTFKYLHAELYSHVLIFVSFVMLYCGHFLTRDRTVRVHFTHTTRLFVIDLCDTQLIIANPC